MYTIDTYSPYASPRMHVCLYASLHIFTYVCMQCIGVCIYVSMYTHVYLCMMWTCVKIDVHTRYAKDIHHMQKETHHMQKIHVHR